MSCLSLDFLSFFFLFLFTFLSIFSPFFPFFSATVCELSQCKSPCFPFSRVYCHPKTKPALPVEQ